MVKFIFLIRLNAANNKENNIISLTHDMIMKINLKYNNNLVETQWFHIETFR